MIDIKLEFRCLVALVSLLWATSVPVQARDAARTVLPSAVSRSVPAQAASGTTTFAASTENTAAATTLEVRNHSTTAMSLEVDGVRVGYIDPLGSIRISSVASGRRWLTARDGERIIARIVPELPPQGYFLWSLGQADNSDAGVPTAKVRNATGAAIRVFVDGHHRIDLGPGESTTMVGLARFGVRLEAQTLQGQIVARAALNWAEGEEQVWTVPGPDGATATVEVRNPTRSPLKVCVDQRDCRRIPGGARAQFVAVIPGVHQFQALDARGQVRDRFAADIAPGASYEWEIEGEN